MKSSTPAFSAALLAIALCAPAAAFAEKNIAIKPGVWEVRASSGLLSMIPALPPEQMDQLRALASQHGFKLPRIENGAATTRVCVTPAMARSDRLPNAYQEESGCSSSDVRREGNRLSAEIRCSGDRVRGTGHTDALLQNPESFTGRTRFSGTFDGQPVKEEADIGGRWIEASCTEVR